MHDWLLPVIAAVVKSDVTDQQAKQQERLTPVSTTGGILPDELPVGPAETDLVTATGAFPSSAAQMTFFSDPATQTSLFRSFFSGEPQR
ncbi:MAG: hypothetical protein RQ754_03150 [Desulfuromonadales bacterium]|nr:hypothetical protein [Desulfuromonadales bacterium]